MVMEGTLQVRSSNAYRQVSTVDCNSDFQQSALPGVAD